MDLYTKKPQSDSYSAACHDSSNTLPEPGRYSSCRSTKTDRLKRPTGGLKQMGNNQFERKRIQNTAHSNSLLPGKTLFLEKEKAGFLVAAHHLANDFRIELVLVLMVQQAIDFLLYIRKLGVAKAA